MDALQPGQIRVHLKGGNSYDCPEQNKTNVVNGLKDSLERIEHYKPIPIAPVVPLKVTAPAKPVGKTKESLLGKLIKKDKISATDFIGWIADCSSLEDLGIVMKGEGRTTVKNAYKERINELT